MLKLLLQNLFNAHWPKDFNGAGFCLPNEDAPPIQDSKQINHYDLTDEDMQCMAKVLIDENKEIKLSVFYQQWVYPLEAYLIKNKIAI